MKRLILVVMILLVAGVAFAQPREMTFSKVKLDVLGIHVDSDGSDNMELTDPTAGTVDLNDLKTGSGVTSIPLTHHYLFEGNASNIGVGVAKSDLVTSPIYISGQDIALYYETDDFDLETGKFVIKDDAITSPLLADDSVYAANITEGAVGTSEIDTDGVDTDEIAQGAVTTAEIYDGTILNEDIATSTIANGKLALAYRQITTNTVVVDWQGRGDYTTIQAGIDSISGNSSSNPFTVLIMPGVYSETIMLDENWIDLIGISRDACIITRNFAQAGAASYGDGTLNCNHNNLVANLTIRNTGAAPDATIALYLGTGTKYFRNCVFSGAGRDIVTIGEGTNYFNDCRMVNTEAAHVIWIYNGDTIFTDCDIKSTGTLVQFTNVTYTKSGDFYNCLMKCTGTGYIFDLLHGNNTLTVDNIVVEVGGAATLFYNTVGTINLGRVVGEDNNAGTFTMLKNADSAFESINVGTATGAGTGDGKFSGDVIAAIVQPTSGYKSVDGSTGITITLQLMDYSANPHTLTFKNGLLVGHTEP